LPDWKALGVLGYDVKEILLLRGQLMKRLMFVCLILAFIAALGYFLMGIGAISPGDTGTSAPSGFDWIMLTGYIVGGILIFFKKRWLWILGACLNAAVIIGFIAMYAGKPSVMFSAPGLITKIPQILLEAGLVYLIIKCKKTAAK
jgi:hypothetical protein